MPVIPTRVRNETLIAVALPGSVDVHFATHVLVPLAEVGVGAGLREIRARRRAFAAERDVERAVGPVGHAEGDRVLDLVLIRPRDPRAGVDGDAAGAELEELDRDTGRRVGGGRCRDGDGPPDGHTLKPHGAPPARVTGQEAIRIGGERRAYRGASRLCRDATSTGGLGGGISGPP